MIARFAAVILACLASAGIAAAQTAVSPKPDLSARNPHADPLRGGWYPWDPYQYRDYRRGVPVLTGFDVEIERALERILGVEILLPETAWNAHLEALAAGTADIAAGATRSEARSAFAYFSKPYRSETDVLILPKGAARRYAFSTIDEMLESFAKQKFRLGVVAGFVYADSRVNAFIADPTNEDFIVPQEVMLRICRISSRASLTASLPTVSPRRPRLGASIRAHASRSMGYASPPIFISC
jgi:polar amino acid transport system substrate-binding protein